MRCLLLCIPRSDASGMVREWGPPRFIYLQSLLPVSLQDLDSGDWGHRELWAPLDILLERIELVAGVEAAVIMITGDKAAHIVRASLAVASVGRVSHESVRKLLSRVGSLAGRWCLHAWLCYVSCRNFIC
jgi:hypothetical protein